MVASEEDEEESMEEDGEDDDPERLWCICQKPHNNRFMICCDRCEDWFHGSCVGVTKAIGECCPGILCTPIVLEPIVSGKGSRCWWWLYSVTVTYLFHAILEHCILQYIPFFTGQQMEEEGREWVCPKCKKTERAMKGVVVLGKKKLENTLITKAFNNQTVKAEQQAPLSPTKVIKRIVINKPDDTENQLEVKKPVEAKKAPERKLGGLSGFTIPKKVNVVHENATQPKKTLSDDKKTGSPQVIKVAQKKMLDGGREVRHSLSFLL